MPGNCIGKDSGFSKPQTDGQTQASEFDWVELLSERELEILQLIADGLFLSLHTIKTHTRNIYGKLNVYNRTQAITRAQTLGLLTHKLD